MAPVAGAFARVAYPSPAMPATPAPETAARMAGAARAFLALLEPHQGARVLRPLGDEAERRRWNYAPTARAGLPLLAMSALQQRAAHRLAASGLSRSGYVAASAIIGLENALDAVEGWRDVPSGLDTGSDRWRDPQLYFVTIFGDPDDASWGWRFEGHHVSLHYTVSGGTIAPTPVFLGANPAASPLGMGLLRPLAGEEDLARELLRSLDAEQCAAARISAAAPPDIVQSNRPRVEAGALPLSTPALMGIPGDAPWDERARAERERLGYGPEQEAALRYGEPRGLDAAALDAGQRERLAALAALYVDRLPDELAAEQRARLADGGLDAMRFAWAGGVEPGQPHYYRLQAPRFLVEYDCAQNEANHVHAVWRDPDGDFGEDLLARHLAAAHGGPA